MPILPQGLLKAAKDHVTPHPGLNHWRLRALYEAGWLRCGDVTGTPERTQLWEKLHMCDAGLMESVHRQLDALGVAAVIARDDELVGLLQGTQPTTALWNVAREVVSSA